MFVPFCLRTSGGATLSIAVHWHISYFQDYLLGILGLYLYRTAEDMKGEREGERHAGRSLTRSRRVEE